MKDDRLRKSVIIRMLKSDLVIFLIPVLFSEASIEFLQPLPPVVEGCLHHNLTLHCRAVGEIPLHILWTKNGEPIVDESSWGLAHKEALVFHSLKKEDAGQYTCAVQNAYERQYLTTKLIIKSPPEPLANLTVQPSTILATIMWHVKEDGGSPITNFTLLYKRIQPDPETTWHQPMPPHLSPSMHQVDIFHLRPNTTYFVRIWANNMVGPGEPVEKEFTTLKPVNSIDLTKRMLSGSDEFTPTAWVLAVLMVLATIVVLGMASCILLYKEWRLSQTESRYYEHDDLELVPHLIVSYGFELDRTDSAFVFAKDENCNTQNNYRYSNNNTVVHPCRV